MAYWLLKSEPGTWSWDDQLKKGDECEGWDVVRNYQDSKKMKKNLSDYFFDKQIFFCKKFLRK